MCSTAHSEQDVSRAEQLIFEYTTELIHLYGSGSVKPNHHFATHIGGCVRNFGPLHDFWTFLFKRLNKLLKSYKTNNHSNGALETTFFMEFHRTCELGRLTYTLQHYPKDSLPSQTASIMLKASNDERGTVAGLAALSKDLDDAGADVFFDYVVIDTVGTNCSSLVHVIIPGITVIHAYGEVLEIFQFNQRFRNVDDSLWFARMRWFVPWRGEREKVWDDFYSADVRLWQLGEYKSRETQLPSLINPDWIVGHLGMTTVSIGKDRTKVWATIDLKGLWYK
ncbi:hypothetical protein EV702DRAFT_1047887 [Suillus placidus]|uniref:Uncharacterized protein n=1 Tax=Suillus placidus TaxID=48579 RepID=A0A9P7D0A5_9AGAM|nr:hypothetical protein EV702DRAFT_1047887 [Suillus placidus]